MSLVARTAARALSLGKNPHEWAARAKKVDAMLGVLTKLGPLPTSTEAAAWPENVWTDLARAAGINPPSEKTRAFVVAQLRLQERS